MHDSSQHFMMCKWYSRDFKKLHIVGTLKFWSSYLQKCSQLTYISVQTLSAAERNQDIFICIKVCVYIYLYIKNSHNNKAV